MTNVYFESDLAWMIYEKGLLTTYVKPGFILDEPEMKRMLQDAVKLANGEHYSCIVDISQVQDSTPAARRHYRESELSRFRKADAFIVNSLFIRNLVNFYMKFYKPALPTRMFQTVGQAESWIRHLNF